MKLRPFELALVVIFVIFIAISLIFLSSYKPNKNSDGLPVIGQVSIWGTLPSAGIDKILFELSEQDEQYRGVSYRYLSPDNFNSELVNALADGEGPDLVLMSHERLVELRKRIQAVSYDSLPLRDVRNQYIDGAQIFALSDGMYAYPIAVDPLLMYWNRDILATDGYLAPPATWEDLVNNYFPTLIRRNSDRSIDRSVVAFGNYGNVKNAFGIVSMLLIQSGTAGVKEDGSEYSILLNQTAAGSGEPLRVAADFYTRFSKPSNSLYSWNRSFTEDQAQFLSEDLAFYFGYGSEGKEIERLNPNLNFDVAEVPQGAAATVRRTYGRFYGLAALRTSDNLPGASTVMMSLGNAANSGRIAAEYNLVPALRSLVGAGSNDTYGRVAYKSAAIAYGWLSPSEPKTDSIFETMTQDLSENRRDLDGAIKDAVERLQLEYN